MTKEFLLKIMKASFNIDVKDDFFNRLYEPEYYTQPIDEYKLKSYCSNALTFDYNLFDLIFVKGEVSCTGLTFQFRSDRFEKILVSVFYDSFEKKIYNSVLAIPKYTENDYLDRKSINQRSRKVKSNSDLKKVFNDLYKRFECPVIN